MLGAEEGSGNDGSEVVVGHSFGGGAGGGGGSRGGVVKGGVLGVGDEEEAAGEDDHHETGASGGCRHRFGRVAPASVAQNRLSNKCDRIFLAN